MRRCPVRTSPDLKFSIIYARGAERMRGREARQIGRQGNTFKSRVLRAAPQRPSRRGNAEFSCLDTTQTNAAMNCKDAGWLGDLASPSGVPPNTPVPRGVLSRFAPRAVPRRNLRTGSMSSSTDAWSRARLPLSERETGSSRQSSRRRGADRARARARALLIFEGGMCYRYR